MRITIYKLHSFDSGQIVSQVGQIGRQIGPSDPSNGILKSKGRV